MTVLGEARSEVGVSGSGVVLVRWEDVTEDSQRKSSGVFVSRDVVDVVGEQSLEDEARSFSEGEVSFSLVESSQFIFC